LSWKAVCLEPDCTPALIGTLCFRLSAGGSSLKFFLNIQDSVSDIILGFQGAAGEFDSLSFGLGLLYQIDNK
jgi:hypothetical protein